MSFIILFVIFLSSSDAERRLPPGRYHPCNDNEICKDKTDPKFYHPYTEEDQYFYKCQQLKTENLTYPVNLGCQICSEMDTFFSANCQRCLSRRDVDAKNCQKTAGTNFNTPTDQDICPPTDVCLNKANGTYRLSDVKENIFYSCVAGNPTQCQKCPTGLVFYESHQACYAGATRRLSPGRDHACNKDDLCTGKTDPAIYYPYVEDQYFYACHQLETETSTNPVNMGCQICSDQDTFFSASCQRCLSRNDVVMKKCPPMPSPGSDNNLPIVPDPCPPVDICLSRANGTYRLSEAKKNTFYSCVAGENTECQKCPHGLVFSEACQSCHKDDIRNSDDCPRNPDEGGQPRFCSENKFCYGRDDNDYENGKNSPTYNHCTEGSCIEKDCPTGLVFAEVCKRRCVRTYTNVQSQCYNNDVADIPVSPSQKIKMCEPLDFCASRPGVGKHKKGDKEPEFYMCVFGACSVMTCAGDTVYNPNVAYCDYAGNF